MKNMKFWRTALVATLVLTVMLSVTGGTIAWFTDSVSSANNIIKSGNLDIDVQYTLDGETWNNLDKATDLFQKDLWEPGHTEVVVLKVENKGSLALKYNVNMNIVNEEIGKTKDGADIKLSDILTISTLTLEDAGVDPWFNMNIAAEAVKKAFEGEDAIGWGTPAAFTADSVLTAEQPLYVGKTQYAFIKVDMDETVGNEANHNGTDVPSIDFGINVLATQYTYEEDSFNDQYDAEAEYPTGNITADTIDEVDFSEPNKTYVLSGEFGDITLNELGEGSKIKFDDATVGALALADDAVLTGSATIASIDVVRNDTALVEVTVSEADFDVTGHVNVKNTLGKSVLNIENSSVQCGILFVGEHTNTATAALAEFNVKNSYLRCLNPNGNSTGSVIAVWGRSGVKAEIYDSEIHTYGKGWHSSEDANGNSLTFQGATSIDVDIQRSNIHTYGARSIINARQYGGEETTFNTKIDDSLIWVTTKSTHGDTTIPVWGFNEITDTALVFTKDVTKTAVDSSFVYGNPVIHGNFNLHSSCNCSWNAHVALDDETVTFAADANVSVDEACTGSLKFVLSDSATVVVEEGASVTGKVNVVAADGYKLNTVTSNGVTTYSVTAN